MREKTKRPIRISPGGLLNLLALPGGLFEGAYQIFCIEGAKKLQNFMQIVKFNGQNVF